MRVTYKPSHLDIGQFVVSVSGTDNILILFGCANGNNGSITGGMCYFFFANGSQNRVIDDLGSVYTSVSGRGPSHRDI